MEDTNQQEDYNPYTDKLESQVQKLQKERDELTSENERLREALTEIHRTLSSDDTTLCQFLPEKDSYYKPDAWLKQVTALLSPKSDKP